MALSDEIFQAVDLTNGNGEHQNHGEAGVDAPRRSKRKIVVSSPDNAMAKSKLTPCARQDQRRGNPQEKICGFVAMPVPRRSAPAHRKHAVNHSRGGWVARSRRVPMSGIIR